MLPVWDHDNNDEFRSSSKTHTQRFFKDIIRMSIFVSALAAMIMAVIDVTSPHWPMSSDDFTEEFFNHGVKIDLSARFHEAIMTCLPFSGPVAVGT